MGAITAGAGAGGANRVMEVSEKGPKGFTVQTVSLTPFSAMGQRHVTVDQKCAVAWGGTELIASGQSDHDVHRRHG